MCSRLPRLFHVPVRFLTKDWGLYMPGCLFLASDRHCQTVTTVCNLHVSHFKDDWCLLHPHITHRSSFRNRASFSQYISFDVVTWNTLNL